MECVFEPGQILFRLNLNLLPLNTPNQRFDLLTIVSHCWGMVAFFFFLLAQQYKNSLWNL